MFSLLNYNFLFFRSSKSCLSDRFALHELEDNSRRRLFFSTPSDFSALAESSLRCLHIPSNQHAAQLFRRPQLLLLFDHTPRLLEAQLHQPSTADSHVPHHVPSARCVGCGRPPTPFVRASSTPSTGVHAPIVFLWESQVCAVCRRGCLI